MTREEELYKLYEQGFEKVLALLLQKQKLGKNVKIHQNIVIFYKGDTNKIKDTFYNIQEEYFNVSENE